MADVLKTTLSDLVRRASTAGMRLYLGGGYGLYLKQLHLAASRERTLLPPEAWPRPRATPDLDIFLPTEIVVDLRHMTTLREVLDGLGYEPVPTAKFMHFEKRIAEGTVRVELLTGPIGDDDLGKVHVRRPRVRPRGVVELHAYLAPDAVTFEVEPVPVPLEADITVHIPNAFAFLVMKLHACNDRIDDEDKQMGRHHALDVYRILAMLTEPEERLVRKLRIENRDSPAVRTAQEIALTLFASPSSRGVLRLREHALAHDEMQVEATIEILTDVFCARAAD